MELHHIHHLEHHYGVCFQQGMLIYGKEATTQIENSVPYYSVSKWSSNTKMLLLHFHAP